MFLTLVVIPVAYSLLDSAVRGVRDWLGKETGMTAAVPVGISACSGKMSQAKIVMVINHPLCSLIPPASRASFSSSSRLVRGLKVCSASLNKEVLTCSTAAVEACFNRTLNGVPS